MQRIAKFERVSEGQFRAAWQEVFGTDGEEAYGALKLPARATAGSAGYDFFSPLTFTLDPGQSIRVPTGIRVRIEEGWMLQIYPRSGLGFKYRLQLDNTVGIVDSDYYGSDNEGHIFIKVTNDSRDGRTLTVQAGTGFAQGIFVAYGITTDDDAYAIRNGGFGSTTKR